MREYLPGPYRLIMAEIAGEGDTMRKNGKTPTHDPDCALGSGAGCDCGLVALRGQAAAAPQLVAALELCVRQLEGADNTIPFLAEARAALAAARGEGSGA